MWLTYSSAEDFPREHQDVIWARNVFVLEMRRGRKVDSSRIDQPDDQHIGEVEEEGYRFLGILLFD